uniref:retinitis pigmentosa GTPase regulator b isoform X2 n=1 Tax=Scatophagus argus TaxID=75038 RepID=UPI001ED7CFBA|nr:retinitis pigmentosa GTPase regulator b isoform X2 [Scatophagus argus]
MAGEAEDEIPESGAVFTFGKSKFADNIPSKFWLKNDIPLKIACGDEHTALITENGKLFMFGSNNWGQLGLGSKVTVNKPTCVKALKSEKVHLVACGRNHTLICTAEGKVFASGGNSEGQLGLGDCEERTAFQRIHGLDGHGPIKMLAAGSNTSAALTGSGKLFMWGDNTEGQIGLGKESHASSPQEVSVGRPISWVSCGYYHSALVTVDGALFTFGECDSGKLGLGTDQLPRHRVPQLVKSIKEPVIQVACGGGHTVALTEDDVFTFGLGQFGQLGHGTFIFESRLPRPVDHFKKGRVCQVTCGENHTAVVTDGGLLYTFGDGRHGKLGLGEENFTNQFKPTLCPRFLKYNVQAAACGGCHMVVLARPRDRSCGHVTLEEDDVTEDFLEKPYVELLGDSADSSTLQRSLSARVRRRERDRSPDQFGSTFRTLPSTMSGYLHPPLPVSSQTIPPRLPPPELSHRKTGGETDSVVESLTDADSVKDLGETTDFLNMTHVMKMDPSDNTLTLAPVQKRKVLHGKTSKEQKEIQKKDRKLLKQSSFSSTSPSGKSETVSPRRPLPTERLKGHSARALPSQSLQRQKTANQNKENVLMAVEELQGKAGKNKPQGVEDIRKAASKQRLRPAGGKSQLMEVGRKLPESLETRKTVSGVGSESAVGRVKQVQPKPVSVNSKPIVVQSQRAGVSSPGVHRHAGSPGIHLSGANQESFSSPQLLSEVKQTSRSTENSHFSKKSKNEKNKKESKVLNETQDEASDLDVLAGAASLAAGSMLMHEVVSRSRFSSAAPSPTKSNHGVLRDSATKSRSEESESYAADLSNKSAVSINIIPAPESQDEKETSQDEKETSEDEKGMSQDEKETSQDEKEMSQADSEEESEKQTASVSVKQEEEEDEEGQRTSAEVSEEEEEEDVSHSIEKVTEEEEEEDTDSNTLQPEGESETDADEEESREEEEDESNVEEEEEEEESSGMAGSEIEGETEEKESKGSDVEEEEEEEEAESEEGSNHETESKGGESEIEEEGEEEEGDLESEDEEEEEGREESDVESQMEGEEEEEEEKERSNEEEEESSEAEESENEEESEEEVEEEEEEEEEESEDEQEEEEEEEAEGESAEEEAAEEEDQNSEEEEEEEEEEGEEEEEEEADDQEEEEEEEEEVIEKKKSADVKRKRDKARGDLRSGVKGQAAGESEEFWDDVLPQYLNLK